MGACIHASLNNNLVVTAVTCGVPMVDGYMTDDHPDKTHSLHESYESKFLEVTPCKATVDSGATFLEMSPTDDGWKNADVV